MIKHKMIKVKVTKQHIKNGKQDNVHFCPIALAVRALGYKRVTVDSDNIITRNACFSMPYEASDFVFDFDEFRPVKPFTFIALTED